ncbi:hypothetical protein QAD02_020996 [Eretmocerus hayati]|uniref:Uncharacterized protein n=1 Tax=Eretmocerus hayati TaxID=131215 RepID=A0ACC2PQ16_9HYME|nr:hypothetical protein QAD02_020996 [Eretmocerus hayati]
MNVVSQLLQDFGKVYPEAVDGLNNKWDSVCNDIVTHALEKYEKFKFTPWGKSLIDSGNQKSLGFFCLAKCLGGSYQLKAGLKRKSMTTDPFESDRDLLTKSSFILAVESEEKFSQFRTVKEGWEALWENLEPYVAVVGNRPEALAVYVII